ncbi:uncharacterized protein FOMMEDRAFT_166819 [Fomitiporia mediterranea MF3/22]|uniref:uncharacterized protein n=1 Tax=Fomitiporia mediterranea (strain MF3/22) TaxID=694068 RepID=UPI0004409959|nr:uncharacterized protein FOMMEDRAFT_166819 [Fomitiporia mediterranea MF3/22]EJD05193.1 hypothetical protein FOMMEDRAFT_166819 [Fomitiporia mediterranea MF3/22]
MVVLTEKDIVPPPPYFAIENDDTHPSSKLYSTSARAISRSTSSVALASSSSQSHLGRRPRKTAPSLPSHVLLLIVYSTLPRLGEYRYKFVVENGIRTKVQERERESNEEFAVRTTRTLYWMAFCLRSVSRGFYLAAMHILRSTFLPHYMQRVRPPYSSDPFPHTSLSSHRPGDPSSARSGAHGTQTSISVVSSMQCESEVLDRYILHQLHEDVFADDSSLNLAHPERLRDLFDFMQPRARLMDLVRMYGVGAGLISLSDSDADAEIESAIGTASFMADTRENECRKGSSLTGMNLKAKMARSTSTLTLVNSPPSPSPSSTSYAKSYTYSPPSLRIPSSSIRQQQRRKKIPYPALRIFFSPRQVGLIYTAPPSNIGTSTRASTSAPRTIVNLARTREESLERSASRLVMGLKAWMEGHA